MKIAFRTDASTKIGTGHFMRCLTLADELKKQGAHIRFLSRNLPNYLMDMLRIKEIEYVPLENDEVGDSIDELAHASWLGVSQAQDSQVAIKALSDQVWDWLIVDHYALDTRWEKALRSSVKHIMVIDDLADRQHDCDLLLDQNYYAKMQVRYNGRVPVHCKLLLGPRYALLRDEFRAFRKLVKIRTGKVKKILVFFGGVDPDNFTSLAIKALADLKVKLSVDVVIGAEHPNREQIEQACIAHHYNYFVQTSRMAELMAGADLAIGAGGSATWERCSLGLPTIVCAIAPNQIKATSDLSELGAIISIDIKQKMNLEILKREVKKALERNNLKKISSLAYTLVDGNGVNYILEILEGSYGR